MAFKTSSSFCLRAPPQLLSAPPSCVTSVLHPKTDLQRTMLAISGQSSRQRLDVLHQQKQKKRKIPRTLSAFVCCAQKGSELHIKGLKCYQPKTCRRLSSHTSRPEPPSSWTCEASKQDAWSNATVSQIKIKTTFFKKKAIALSVTPQKLLSGLHSSDTSEGRFLDTETCLGSFQ